MFLGPVINGFESHLKQYNTACDVKHKDNANDFVLATHSTHSFKTFLCGLQLLFFLFQFNVFLNKGKIVSVTTATGFFTGRIPSDTDTHWPAKTAQEKQPNLFQSINILVARRVSLIALCRPAETIEENQDTSMQFFTFKRRRSTFNSYHF